MATSQGKRKEMTTSHALKGKIPGHKKNECPMRRKNKKKAMKATWEDNSESELDGEVQEKAANICFMANDNQVKSLELDDDLVDDEIDESYNELLD